MKRPILLVCTWVLFFCGWLSAFWLNAMQLHSTLYVLAPALLLGGGMGLIRKVASRKIMVVTLALTALLAVTFYNQYHPQRRISLHDFKQRVQAGASQTVAVVTKGSQAGAFGESRSLDAAAPIEVSLYAELPGPARMLAFDDLGNLYVSIPDLGVIYLLQDSDKDGFADKPQLYHYDLDRPHGLAWYQDKLFVATASQVLVLSDGDGDLRADQIEVLVDGLPDDGGHLGHSLVVNAAGDLLLAIGSRCNACEESDPRRATLQRIDIASGQMVPFATGLRYSIGLVVAPGSGDLWVSDIGRELQRNIPPDEINRIEEGGDYGWPHCFGQQLPDPTLGSARICRDTRPSYLDLPVHSTPMGLAFGTDLKAPPEYRDSLYVALNGGSGSEPRLVRVPSSDGNLETYAKEFLHGWQQSEQPWGRPVAVVAGPDGDLYLSDDVAAAVYRIHWIGED
jgi:glucose/arabinose dehydrogenase